MRELEARGKRLELALRSQCSECGWSGRSGHPPALGHRPVPRHLWDGRAPAHSRPPSRAQPLRPWPEAPQHPTPSSSSLPGSPEQQKALWLEQLLQLVQKKNSLVAEEAELMIT